MDLISDLILEFPERVEKVYCIRYMPLSHVVYFQRRMRELNSKKGFSNYRGCLKFSQEECEDLRERIKAGLLKRSTVCTRKKFPNPLFCTIIRCGFDGRVGCWIGNENRKWNNKLAAPTTTKATNIRRLSISPFASSALAEIRGSSNAKFYKEVLKDAREKFTQEISFQSKDKVISLEKGKRGF